MKKVILIGLTIFFISACNKEDDIINSSQSFHLNYFDNLFITNDNSLLIGGIYHQKYTLFKTDDNFNIVWNKDNFEWGNVYSGTGWGASIYTVGLIKVFQQNDGRYICFGSVFEGTDVVSQNTLVIELSQQGEQIQKIEFKNLLSSNVIQTNDNGYILFGSKIVKLDMNFNKLWEKDNIHDPYSQYQILTTMDGGFATTGSYNSDQVFLKKYNSNGDEISSFAYKHNEFPTSEAGYDLLQLDDMGFLIIGRTYNLGNKANIDCQIIRTNIEGDTTWTKRFGDSTNDWLDQFIWNNQSEFIIQGDFTTDVPNSILYKINKDGQILDSVRMEKFAKLVYSPSNYFIKVRNVDTSNVNFTKISPDKLFNVEID